jgi:site-specific DNA recombinase
MPTVRRIFEMVANGQTLYGVSKVFDEEGVPTMGGGERWYPVSMKRTVWNDVYKGTWYHGQNRVTLTPAGKNRRTFAANPEDEWITIPVPDSGIPHEIIDRARENLSKNYRPRTQAGHYYELKGLVYCESCGLKMTTYTAGGYRYYICQSRRKFQSCDGAVRSAKTTTKRKRSVGLEDEVMDYVQDLIENPDKLSAQLDAAIAAESTRNPDDDVASWLRAVDECDRKRGAYQDQQAAGLMTLDELADKLRELDRTKATAEEHLANARAGQNRVEELQATKRAMLEAYTAGIAYDGIHSFPAEMRREIYDALQLKVTVSPYGTPRYQGLANAQVIRLTRGVEEYGHEVEQYREKLRVGGKPSSSKRTATVMAEVAG